MSSVKAVAVAEAIERSLAVLCARVQELEHDEPGAAKLLRESLENMGSAARAVRLCHSQRADRDSSDEG